MKPKFTDYSIEIRPLTDAEGGAFLRPFLIFLAAWQMVKPLKRPSLTLVVPSTAGWTRMLQTVVLSQRLAAFLKNLANLFNVCPVAFIRACNRAPKPKVSV